MIVPEKELGYIVIEYTETYIKKTNEDDSLSDFKQDLRNRIEDYRQELLREQSNIDPINATPDERVAQLLRGIFITYELIKIDQLIEERYNDTRRNDNK